MSLPKTPRQKKPKAPKPKTEDRWEPVLRDFVQDMACFSVPSSDGSKTYFPCIEIYAQKEVFCQCTYFNIKAAIAEELDVTITVYDYEKQCWHLRDAIQICMKEDLL